MPIAAAARKAALRSDRAAFVHVGHDAGATRVFRPELPQSEAGGADEIVGLTVEVTAAGDTSPQGSQPVLPALDGGFGRQPVFGEKKLAARRQNATDLLKRAERFGNRT